MIAAVLDSSGPMAVRERFARLGAAAGLQAADILIEGSVGIASWEGSPVRTRLDVDRKMVALGRVEDPAGFLRDGFTRGDFSLAALQRQGLSLSRSRFGGRPLFYAHTSGGVMVACSRLTPLSMALDPPPPLNVERLAAAAMLEDCDDDAATLYGNISRVRSCETLHLRLDGRLAITRSTLRAASLPTSSPDEIAELLRHHLSAAVERATTGLADVGVLVGGGLDSSFVLATLAEQSRRTGAPRVSAHALDFDGIGSDRPYLEVLSAALGIAPQRSLPKDAAPLVLGSLLLGGSLCPWPTAAQEMLLITRARRAGVSVLLTGTGGDHVFEGDTRVFAQRAHEGNWRGALAGAARLRVPWDSSSLSRMRHFVLAPVLRPLAPSLVNRVRQRRAISNVPWAGPKLREILRRRSVFQSQESDVVASSEERLDALARAPSLMEGTEMRAQMESACRCALAYPLFDDHLVELAAAIPPSLYFHGDRARGLFRHAMRGLVPDRVRLREDKAGFTSAMGAAFKGALASDAFQDLMSVRMLADLGIVEPKRFRRYVDDLVRERGDEALIEAWPPLSAEAFVRARYGERPSFAEAV